MGEARPFSGQRQKRIYRGFPTICLFWLCVWEERSDAMRVAAAAARGVISTSPHGHATTRFSCVHEPASWLLGDLFRFTTIALGGKPQ